MGTEERHVLSRRGLLKAGAAAAVVTVISPPRSASTLLSGSAQAPTGVWNHNPASPIGPLHWADIGFPTCGQGTSQSPVDIRTDRVAGYRGAPMLLQYESSELAVENTGHVVEVPIPADVQDTMQIGGDRYELVQYHFHAPSEHAVNGRLADVEAHFVHMNAHGATAVVGVFYSRGPDPNAVLDKILLSAPATAGEEAHAGEASPAELFQHIGEVSAGTRRPDPGELVLRLRWLAHHAGLHRGRALVGARRWRSRLDGRGGPPSRRDRPVPRL